MTRPRASPKVILACTALAAVFITRPAPAAGFYVSSPDALASVEVEEGLVVFDSVVARERLLLRFVARAVDWAVVVPIPSAPIAREMASSSFEAIESDAAKAVDEGAQGMTFTTSPIPAQGDVGIRVVGVDDPSSATELVRSALLEAGLAWTASLRSWTDLHAARGFHFVILRFHYPGLGASGLVLTKTVEIDFASPLAMYPTTHGEGPAFRLGLTWLVSDQDWLPVAKRSSAAGSRAIAPWHEVWDRAKMTVFGILPVHSHEVLSPLGLSLSISEEARLSRVEQGYADEKSVRDDISDIVFVPLVPGDLGPETRRTRIDLADRVLLP